jgi:hypothetical protein
MKKNILAILTVSFCATLYAQNHDYQTWITTDMKYGFSNSWQASIENEVRLYNNSSLYGINQTEFELFYLTPNKWSFGLGYRTRVQHPFSHYQNTTHRFLLDAVWKTRIKRFRLNLRLRVINDQESLNESILGSVFHREKVRLAYKFRKSPFLIYSGAETFTPFSFQQPCSLRKVRYYVGSRMQLNRISRISLDVIYDTEHNRNNPQHALILQVGYSIDLGKILDD